MDRKPSWSEKEQQEQIIANDNELELRRLKNEVIQLKAKTEAYRTLIVDFMALAHV